MMITTGTRLGPYEIVAPLGAGGMGEVYRARDSRLGREVAIKVMPAAYSADADRLRRFEQEARAAGQLNHPNILTIYDIGTHDGAPYIVSELLDGEELRAQLNGGALPVRRAIDYARQIACGLSAAHEKGITHRDLKPENLFITTDGRVKILDFGLAKLKPQPVHAGVDSEAPTALPASTTDPGTVMGTVGYMAPEQVQGQEAAHRADIFALGVILYEMLSGRRAFEGASSAEVMSAILRDEPEELQEINEKIPPQLERVVRRCLEKRPGQRFQSTSDLAFALEALFTPSGSRLETNAALAAMTASTGASSKLRRERLAWIAAALFLLVSLASLPFAIAYFRRDAAEVRAVRSFILPPEKSSFNFAGFSAGPVTVSPDGRRLAFVATTAEGKNLLWVRELSALSAQPLAGTERASSPFWSADSRSVGFFAEGKLKKIEATGGPALTLCDAPEERGGTWSRDGVIVFARNGVLHRVSASGGPCSRLAQPDEARSVPSHRWPYFLPDGQHFLYLARRIASEGEPGEIYVASLDEPRGKLLLQANSNAAYSQGYLLFVREGALMAQPFDAGRLETVGDAFPIAEQIQYEVPSSRGVFSVSEQGVLAYQVGGAVSGSRLTWFDRSGKPLGVLGDPAPYSNLHLSPNGKRAVVNITDPQTGQPNLWLIDVASGLRTRFTFDPASERSATWSLDSTRIAFASNRKGHYDLYQKASSGASGEELLLESDFDKIPTSFSPNGRLLLYTSAGQVMRQDLWVLPLDGDRNPSRFLQTEFAEAGGRFSPDGRWVAYNSDESRRNEIYVMPFPGPGGKRQVSTSGGSAPRWRADGKEIFYLAPGSKLMAAEVNGAGETFEVGAVRPLFDVRRGGPGTVYDVAGDGQRFLVITAVEEQTSAPITLVLNWTAELKR